MLPVSAYLWHPSVLKQALMELTPAMKMKRQQQRQQAEAAMLRFRQNLQAGQRVFVSDEPHDEHYFGEMEGRDGAILNLETDGDVLVDVVGTNLTASRARIYPQDLSVLHR
jgi:predicted nucleotidyltransferase